MKYPRPSFSLREALADPGLLGNELLGASWAHWRTVLLATLGEPLTADELEVFQRFTGRAAGPVERLREALYLIGRRGGRMRRRRF